MFKKNKKFSIMLILLIFGLTLLFQIFLYLYMYIVNNEYKNKIDNNYLNIYYLNEFKINLASNNNLNKFLLEYDDNVYDYDYLIKNTKKIIEDIELLSNSIDLKEINELKKEFNQLKKLINKLSKGDLDTKDKIYKEEKLIIVKKILNNFNDLNYKYHELNKYQYNKLINSNFKNINYMYFTIFLNMILFMLIFINWKTIKQEEKENFQNLKRYQLILNSAPNGIVIINKEGKITDINKKALALVKWTSENLIGENYNKLLIDNQINALLENKEFIYNKFFKKSYLKDLNNKEIEIETFVSKNDLDKEDFIIMVVIKEKS